MVEDDFEVDWKCYLYMGISCPGMETFLSPLTAATEVGIFGTARAVGLQTSQRHL